MRVLQLIDSLDPGGAEKIAVTLANELSQLEQTESFLCSTRKQGLFLNQLGKQVGYLHLGKKSTLDLAAILRLYRFIKRNKIEVIHTHSSSFFYGYLMKLMRPKLRLVWHDHYGQSEQLEKRSYKMLKKASSSFDFIISVNEVLQNWASDKLHCKNVIYLKNFVHVFPKPETGITELQGSGRKIICLANLRPQKDHLCLLRAFELFRKEHAEWSLHLVGKDFKDAYSAAIFDYIASSQLKDVFYYGEQFDSMSMLQQADIGVLSSLSEGLPLALLEYGAAALAVVATDVGAIAEVLSGHGALVEPAKPELLARQFEQLAQNPEKARKDANLFHQHIMSHYGFSTIEATLLRVYAGETES